MNDHPKLTEMGVRHPKQIDRFQVSGFSNYDILRIFYARKKGSLLPASRIYKFPRVQKTGIVNNDTREAAVVMESNPDLRQALDELAKLLEAKERKHGVGDSLLDEIALLEEDIAVRSERLKELVKRIQSA